MSTGIGPTLEPGQGAAGVVCRVSGLAQDQKPWQSDRGCLFIFVLLQYVPPTWSTWLKTASVMAVVFPDHLYIRSYRCSIIPKHNVRGFEVKHQLCELKKLNITRHLRGVWSPWLDGSQRDLTLDRKLSELFPYNNTVMV